MATKCNFDQEAVKMDQQTEGYHVKTNNIHSQNIYKNVCKGFVDVEKTA